MQILRRLHLRVIVLCILVSAFAILYLPRATAQTGFASISGRVADHSGAVIQKADITLKNLDTNESLHTVSNNDGIYSFPSVQPGNYLMHVEKLGFRSVDVTGLILYTQDQLARNFALAVGSTSESITVQAGATNESPAVGMVVSRDFLENMPLNGRSFQDLLALAPGAVSSADNQGLFSINGQRDNANYFTVDGVGAPTNPLGLTQNLEGLSGSAPAQTAIGTTQSLVSVDALEEFQIQTSSYAAEYGRGPGGQVEFRTRSGTNDFHGSLFDYLRNEDMDANGWFDNHDNIPRLAHRQNDFGGTFGGPIEVPNLYDGRSRTFFFFSYEGLRLRLPQFVTENVPAVSLRQSASSGVQPFLNAYPIPNGPANADGVSAQFRTGLSDPSSFDALSVRVDHSLNQKVQVFGRYSQTPSSALSLFNNGAGEFSSVIQNTHTVTLGSTLSVSPHFSDELRFNYTNDYAANGFAQTNLGGAVPIPVSLLVPSEYAGVPGSLGEALIILPGSAAGVSYYAVGVGLGTTQRQLGLVDSASWTRGAHLLKFGADWRRLMPEWGADNYENILEFTSVGSLQQGVASAQLLEANQVAKPVFENLSLFVQDQWKFGRNLTLDYGLRWELNPVPGAANGKYPLAVTETSNLATMELSPLGTPVYSTNYHEFAPRVGFSYQLGHSSGHGSVLRVGTGIFYDTGQEMAAAGYFGYPFSALTINTSVSLPLQSASFVPPSLNTPLVPPYPVLIGLVDPRLTLPYTEQWSVALDQQLSQRNTLTISYVGNAGHKLLFNGQYANLGSVNPSFTNAQITYNSGASGYNALQIQDHGYIARGLQVVASYTWAHARDNSSSESGGEQPMWGNSDNDVRQTMNIAANYQIPGRGEGSRTIRALTSNWLLADRFETLTGFPIGVGQGYYCVTGLPTCPSIFPNLVPGQPIYLHHVADIPRGWEVNPMAIAPVPTDPTTGAPLAPGTLGRNFLHGPNFWNLNTSMERNFVLHEGLGLTFRADAFNAFNHPNLNPGYEALGSATFGQLQVQVPLNGSYSYGTGGPRSLQVSLKLHF